MPQIKSAIKRMRSNEKKQIRNQQTLSRLKTLFKGFSKTVAAKDTEKAQKEARTLSKEYDKAASKGIIPKGRADRKKARIANALNNCQLSIAN